MVSVLLLLLKVFWLGRVVATRPFLFRDFGAPAVANAMRHAATRSDVLAIVRAAIQASRSAMR